MRQALLAVATTFWTIPALPSHASTAQCSYWNEKTDVYLDGECVIEERDSNGNFAYRLLFNDSKDVTIEYVKSQSGHHIWRINTVLGWGYEINRCHLVGADNNLEQILEISFNNCD